MSLQKRFFGEGLKSMPSVTKETKVHLKSNSQLNPASNARNSIFSIILCPLSVVFLVISFSTSELLGDKVKEERLKFSYLLNNWMHVVASELKVTNPLKKEQGGCEWDIREGDKLDSTEHQGLSLIHKAMWH